MSFSENNKNTKKRKTLDPNKIYLYICYTYNNLTEENFSPKIHQLKSTLYGECNTGFSVIKKKGKLGNLDNWINPEVIDNILYIKIIEKYSYCVTYDTKEELIMYTPEGKMINLKRDYGGCEGIPYMELRNT